MKNAKNNIHKERMCFYVSLTQTCKLDMMLSIIVWTVGWVLWIFSGDMLHGYYSCMLDICIFSLYTPRIELGRFFLKSSSMSLNKKTECQTKPLGLIVYFLFGVVIISHHATSHVLIFLYSV